MPVLKRLPESSFSSAPKRFKDRRACGLERTAEFKRKKEPRSSINEAGFGCRFLLLVAHGGCDFCSLVDKGATWPRKGHSSRLSQIFKAAEEIGGNLISLITVCLPAVCACRRFLPFLRYDVRPQRKQASMKRRDLWMLL